MSMLAVLLPLGLLLIAFALGIFWWAAKNGQFDDLETPGWRIILDDDHAALTKTPPAEDRLRVL